MPLAFVALTSPWKSAIPRSSTIRLPVLVGLPITLLTLLPNAHADKVIHDQTFLTSNWSLVLGPSPGVSSVNAFRQAGTGVTGDRRIINISGSNGLFYDVRNYFSGVTWNPSVDGVITGLSWEAWYIFNLNPGNWQTLKIVARQGSSQYVANNSYREPQNQNSFWQRWSGGLSASDFALFAGSGPSQLDFSSSAPQIEFGYQVLSSVSLNTTSVSVNNSFFDLQVRGAPVASAAPEPAPLALLAISLLGMAALRSRQRYPRTGHRASEQRLQSITSLSVDASVVK